MEDVRRAASVGRGRGACTHPDGTAKFVVSAMEAFGADIDAHRWGGGCGLSTYGVLPLPVPDGSEGRVAIDWSRCDGHGLCAYLVPELIQLDRTASRGARHRHSRMAGEGRAESGRDVPRIGAPRRRRRPGAPSRR